MKITFEQVVPNPMKNSQFSPDSVWNGQIELNSQGYHFVSSDSGKGKSTFLSYIYGIRNDFSGHLCLDGRSVKEISLSDWADLRKNKLSILPQDLKLFSHLTAWENLTIKNNLTQHKSESEIMEMMEMFGLEKKRDQKAGTLSLGQQQRIALIRCLLQPFELLLLDEPFSNIDEKNIKIAKQLILDECKKNNAGFIIATLGYSYGMEENEIIKL